MINNISNINKFKIDILKKYYNKISFILSNLDNHILNLERLMIFSNTELNNLKISSYEFIKNLNKIYNNEMMEYLNNNNSIIDNLLSNYTYNNEKNNILNNILNNIPVENSLFKKFNENITKIIKNYGYSNLIQYFKFLKFSMEDNVEELINEINDLVIPISIDYFNVNNEKREFYWRHPNNFDEKDYLKKVRELWIKYENNKYMKIKLVFKVDFFSYNVRTCQLNRTNLYNKKVNILDECLNKNFDKKFINLFIKQDYLGNIYSYNLDEYILYMEKQYNNFLELSNSNFINLMKNFISKEKEFYDTFNLIFLLLLGDDEKIDIAGLLLGLVKEKNIINKLNIYEFILNNLNYYLILKLKRSSSSIKNKINKIKNISLNDVDYKKQLVINKNIPDNIKNLVLEKIEEMKSFNNEYYKQQTYVKTIINYPWPSKKDDIFFKNLSKDEKKTTNYIKTIDNKLKQTCYGHEESKKSILQIIGKWISNPTSHGMSFGFVGPPGVGKTLLAKSLSKALDIPFAEITLGGQNDGELLHGHGYTYSGSQPGLIVKKMVDMGKSRCILYFDELDKACSKHGNINEITSILIHLTDPNMNKNFQDRFFQGVDFPLDKVIFIFSYNDSSLIDPILLDRIKEIKIAPYNLEDKLLICKNYIIPEIETNIKVKSKLSFSNNILEYLINNYTLEAGVRGIKRKIEEIFLNINLDILYQNKLFKKSYNKINITTKLIQDILKKPDIHNEKIINESSIGVINGLYATTNGYGGIINIQIHKNLHGGENMYEIKLTGNQGSVMKESVQCSLTCAIEYLEKNKDKYKLGNFNEYLKTNFKNGFHIHTPSTSTPKDGPSAGCAFTCAFISRILGKKINNKVGMTGEIDLMGNITKIGGLEFKIQGAKNAGVNLIYIPQENKEDFEKIKLKYKKIFTKGLKIILVSNISEVIDNILI